MNIQNWFPLGLTGLISLQSKGLKNLLQPQFKSINFDNIRVIKPNFMKYTQIHQNWEAWIQQEGDCKGRLYPLIG